MLQCMLPTCNPGFYGACLYIITGVGTGGARGAMAPPNFTKGGPNGIWPPWISTPVSPVIFDLDRKYSNHLNKLHGVSSQPFRSVLVNETYCCSLQISSMLGSHFVDCAIDTCMNIHNII